MAAKIEDYGLIGNMRTAALVSRTGSIDWLCAPEFDSDACFASLVGYDEHGRWSIRPRGTIRDIRQHYDGDTLVLVTEFECEDGVVRLTDFMPPGQPTNIMRIIDGVAGDVALEMVLAPRFGYGAYKPWISRDGKRFTMTAGPDALCLWADVDTVVRDGSVVADLTVHGGDRITLQLAWFASHEKPPAPLEVAGEHARTLAYWQEWIGRMRYEGRYRDAVARSLLTLKALTHAATGAVVAAPTAGLPEQIGGSRNWDYRFCWLRDASLTLQAMLYFGYVEEATAFRDWLQRAVAGDPDDIQIMYDIRGGRRLTETDLEWLPGYEGSSPVRIGNAASEQFQLDVLGEVAGALYLARSMGMAEAPDAGAIVRALVSHLERVWQQPDDGIWEVRGGRQHFTHSKVMAWVAADRILRIIEEFGTGGIRARELLPRLQSLRSRIHDEVCERGFNPRIGAFTQYYGGETLDASALVIPHYGFLPPHDSRIVKTVEAIERELLHDGFVLRYRTEHGVDGLAGSEGAFLACSFWLADNYAFIGRMDDAEALLDRLLGLRNHLGLWAEEWEPRLGRQVGNFPQGFSHLAFVTTVRVLEDVARAQAGHRPAAAAAG